MPQEALGIGTIFENGMNFQSSLQHFQLLSGTCAEMRFCGNSVKSPKFVFPQTAKQLKLL